MKKLLISLLIVSALGCSDNYYRKEARDKYDQLVKQGQDAVYLEYNSDSKDPSLAILTAKGYVVSYSVSGHVSYKYLVLVKPHN